MNKTILLFKKLKIFHNDDKTHESFIATSFYGFGHEYEIMSTHLHNPTLFDA